MYKILVIEDDPHVLDNIRELLVLYKYNVFVATNGTKGIELAQIHLPDLIISDINMPGISGFEVLENLRKDPITYYIPLIFLTARVSEQDNAKGLMLGADAYIQKPYKNDYLLTVVKSKIERYISQKSNAEEKLNELRENLTYSLPHEFRTPLNGILGFSNILLTDFSNISDDDKLMMISHVHDSAIRLNNMILNFLYYSKLLAQEKVNRIDKHLLTHNSGSLIYELVQNKAMRAGRLNDVEFDLTDCILAICENDFAKLINELTDNALKFSESGSNIIVSSNIENELYHIIITNSGRRINSKDIENIGGFVQFDRREHEQQGIGLGLAIVKKILEIYGGNISVDTVNNEQITIHVYINIFKENN